MLEHQIRIKTAEGKTLENFPPMVYFSKLSFQCSFQFLLLAYARYLQSQAHLPSVEKITEHERKKMQIFSLLSGSEEQRRKIANHLIQLIGIAGLVYAVQDIINFLFCPVTWMYPVVKTQYRLT